ncbi:MAG TPA: hypothetical protein VH482_13925 [Thermomicrobiales bacterium]|jgi:hypothetical protein
MSAQPDYQPTRPGQVVDIQPVAQEERRVRLKHAYQDLRQTDKGRTPDLPDILVDAPDWPSPRRGLWDRLHGPAGLAQGLTVIRQQIKAAALKLHAAITRGKWVMEVQTSVEADSLEGLARKLNEMQSVVDQTDENTIAGEVLERQYLMAVRRIEETREDVLDDISKQARSMPNELTQFAE